MVGMMLLLPQVTVAQSAAPEVNLSASRDGEFVNVSASVELHVDRDLAWSVLTDYEQYPRFVTSLNESRVIARGPDNLVLEHKGEFRFLLFSQKIELRLLVIEYPQYAVASQAIDGSFREFTSRYELLPLADKGVRLVYTARFVPGFSLPPIIGMTVVEFAMRRDLSQLAGEIVRRGALADLRGESCGIMQAPRDAKAKDEIHRL